jgi:fructokinase
MIVSCGEALVDLVPEAVPGGGPMNVAVAAARLGVPSAFVGGVSNDEYGHMIWQHLVDNGVDLRAAQRFAAPTARAIVDHVPHLVFRFEGTSTADTQVRQVDLSLLGPGPHVLHGGTLGLFRGDTAETLARLVESHCGIVSLDPNIRPQIIEDRAQWEHFHDRWLTHTSIYKGSDEDLAWIWPGRSPDSIAEELVAGSVVAVLITRGADGLSVITSRGEQRVPSPEVTVIDTVGAGDTIVGAVLATLWELGDGNGSLPLGAVDEASWALAARRAVAAAGVTVSRAGADPPTRDEIAW